MATELSFCDSAGIDVRLRDEDLSCVASEIRKHVFQWMLETRPEKFKSFLKWLKRFRMKKVTRFTLEKVYVQPACEVFMNVLEKEKDFCDCCGKRKE